MNETVKMSPSRRSPRERMASLNSFYETVYQPKESLSVRSMSASGPVEVLML